MQRIIHAMLCGAVLTGWVVSGYANHTLDQLAAITTTPKVHQDIAIAEHAKRNNPQDAAIAALAKNYELVVFYLSTCPHCHRFLPILKSFSQLTHIPLQPYTLDGKSMPGFPTTKVPPSALVQKLFPQGAMVPALYLLNRTNGHTFTVGIGEETPAQLLNRMREFAPKVLAYEEAHHE